MGRHHGYGCGRAAILVLVFLACDAEMMTMAMRTATTPFCDPSVAEWRQTTGCHGKCQLDGTTAAGTVLIDTTRPGYCDCGTCQEANHTGIQKEWKQDIDDQHVVGDYTSTFKHMYTNLAAGKVLPRWTQHSQAYRNFHYNCGHLPVTCAEVCGYIPKSCGAGYTSMDAHVDPDTRIESTTAPEYGVQTVSCTECGKLCDETPSCAMYQCDSARLESFLPGVSFPGGWGQTSQGTGCTLHTDFEGRVKYKMKTGRINATLCASSRVMSMLEEDVDTMSLFPDDIHWMNSSCLDDLGSFWPRVRTKTSLQTMWYILIVAHLVIFVFLFGPVYLTQLNTKWTCECVPFDPAYNSYHVYHRIGLTVPMIHFDDVEYFNVSNSSSNCGDSYLALRIAQNMLDAFDDFEFPPLPGDWVVGMDCERIEDALELRDMMMEGTSDLALRLKATTVFESKYREAHLRPFHMTVLRGRDANDENFRKTVKKMKWDRQLQGWKPWRVSESDDEPEAEAEQAPDSNTGGASLMQTNAESTNRPDAHTHHKHHRTHHKHHGRSRAGADGDESKSHQAQSIEEELETNSLTQLGVGGKRRKKRRATGNNEAPPCRSCDGTKVVPASDRPNLATGQRPHSSKTTMIMQPKEQQPIEMLGRQQFTTWGDNLPVVAFQVVLFMLILAYTLGINLSPNLAQYVFGGKPTTEVYWVNNLLPPILIGIAFIVFFNNKRQAYAAGMAGRYQPKDMMAPSMFVVMAIIMCIANLYDYAATQAISNKHEQDWAGQEVSLHWVGAFLTAIYFLFVAFMYYRKITGALTPAFIDYETADLLLALEAGLSAFVSLIVDSRHQNANGGSCHIKDLATATNMVGPKELRDKWGEYFGQVDCGGDTSMNSEHSPLIAPTNEAQDVRNLWTNVAAGMSCDVFCDTGVYKTVSCYDYGLEGGQWTLIRDGKHNAAHLNHFCCNLFPCPGGQFQSASCTPLRQRVCSSCSRTTCEARGLNYLPELCRGASDGCVSFGVNASSVSAVSDTSSDNSSFKRISLPQQQSAVLRHSELEARLHQAENDIKNAESDIKSISEQLRGAGSADAGSKDE